VADPYAFRPEWVNPKAFWDDLEKMLAANPTVDSADAGIADQARALIALRKSDANYKSLLDNVPLPADASCMQAVVVYIMVNDHREAIYFIRGTDAKGAPLGGRNTYTMTFAKDGLPPVPRPNCDVSMR